MPFRPVPDVPVPGALFLSSLPGTDETLERFEDEVRSKQVTGIVVLVEEEEITENSPGYAKLLKSSPDWLPARRHLPMRDYGLAVAGEEAFVAAARVVATELREGQRILVHCQAGHGRTGTFAAAVLMALGISREDALARLQRAGSQPETDSQRKLLVEIASKLPLG